MPTLTPSDLDVLNTQPPRHKRASLLRPLIHPDAQDNGDWHAHVWASIVWSHLTEPGDTLAGSLIGHLGAAQSLELVIHGTAEAIREKLFADTGWQLRDPAELDTALKRWRPRWSIQSTEQAIELARLANMRVLTQWDEAWPEGFDRLGSDAPHVLWVRGEVEALRGEAVALVGARAATSYGEHVAQELAADLAKHHVIVSGGAYGIDGAAHRATLAMGGKTVAYLAGGADRLYPAGHNHLLSTIIEKGGAVVSEVPPGSAPTKWRFLQRNRLIAAHAAATIVVEAGWRSGSLNTAGHAVALGRKLGAVPGPITSAASTGCHRLLREFDAVCITSATDVEQLLTDES